MEYWNTGIVIPFQKTQYSRFPGVLRATNPLGIITHDQIEDHFGTRVLFNISPLDQPLICIFCLISLIDDVDVSIVLIG